jgi:hypothetical protein
MRYKDLITNKLEQLLNTHKVLESLISQNASHTEIINWFEVTKERVEEIQTLINSERQD